MITNKFTDKFSIFTAIGRRFFLMGMGIEGRFFSVEINRRIFFCEDGKRMKKRFFFAKRG